jgi:thioredoxin-related protein
MRLLALTTLAVALLGVPTVGIAGGVAHTGSTRDLQWSAWDAGLRTAAATHRPILVDVYTDWCGWCRRMDKDVYSREDVRDYIARRFVTVRLDAESTNPASYSDRRYTESSLAARFRVTGYPTTIFLKPDGEHLVNVPGYVAADRFLLLLQYIGDGHLERGVSFDDFVAKAGARTPDK